MAWSAGSFARASRSWRVMRTSPRRGRRAGLSPERRPTRATERCASEEPQLEGATRERALARDRGATHEMGPAASSATAAGLVGALGFLEEAGGLEDDAQVVDARSVENDGPRLAGEDVVLAVRDVVAGSRERGHEGARLRGRGGGWHAEADGRLELLLQRGVRHVEP